jgi:hypothetical protein
LKSLQQLPALGEIKDFAELDPELELALARSAAAPSADSQNPQLPLEAAEAPITVTAKSSTGISDE